VEGILDRLVDRAQLKALKSKIRKLAMSYYKLKDVIGFPKEKTPKRGNLMQIFIRRDVVDTYAYGSKPYGFPDVLRPNLRSESKKNHCSSGQVRICANPSGLFSDTHSRCTVMLQKVSGFLDQSKVKIFTFMGNKKRHDKRLKLQEQLRLMLKEHYENRPVDAERAKKILFNSKSLTEIIHMPQPKQGLQLAIDRKDNINPTFLREVQVRLGVGGKVNWGVENNKYITENEANLRNEKSVENKRILKGESTMGGKVVNPKRRIKTYIKARCISSESLNNARNLLLKNQKTILMMGCKKTQRIRDQIEIRQHREGEGTHCHRRNWFRP